MMHVFLLMLLSALRHYNGFFAGGQFMRPGWVIAEC
jgi:hypothetical protein